MKPFWTSYSLNWSNSLFYGNIVEINSPNHGSPPETLTWSLVSIWARFLCWILMTPGGWIQASPSTWTGIPSSPRMVIFTVRHWEGWGELHTLSPLFTSFTDLCRSCVRCVYLCNTVMLQFDHPWDSHLHTTKHGDYFQNFIIKWRGTKYLHKKTKNNNGKNSSKPQGSSLKAHP